MEILKGVFNMARAKVLYKLGREGWLRTIKYIPGNLAKEDTNVWASYELY